MIQISPNNNKRGGVGIYFKQFLATRQVELSNLNEYIIFEDCIQTKKECIVSLYRSPSQIRDEFDNFLLNIEQVLCNITARNPLFVFVISDFNAGAA